MDKKQQFLDAEKKAQELTETLTALLIEVESYKGAKENLDSVRQEIVHLIEVIRKNAIETQDLVQRLKDLDQTELVARINGIELKIADHNQKQLHQLEQNRRKIEEKLNVVNKGMDDITTRLKRVEESLNVLKNQGNELTKMKKLIIITLIITIIAMIIGVVSIII